jgi:signal recognition particle GTPase
MEVIFARVIQLEKQMENRKQQESVQCQLNMKLQIGEKLTKEEYKHLYELMVILKNCLDQERERLKNSYFDLKRREQLNNNVFQELRKELVKVNYQMVTIYKISCPYALDMLLIKVKLPNGHNYNARVSRA